MVKAMTPLFTSRSQRAPVRPTRPAARRPEQGFRRGRLLLLGAISKLS